MSNRKLKISLLSLLMCCCCMVSGCGSEPFKYPIADMPEAAKTLNIDEVNIINDTSSSELDYDQANVILGNNSVNVYYDNSQGCFMSYAKADANADMKNMFQQTMRSFRSAFDCSKSYKSYVTQGDSKQNRLVWKELATTSKNVFDDYTNMDIYTPTWASYDYAPDKSPITMWLDIVQSNINKGEDADKSISVYMSDLNENGGQLADAGKKVKEILNSAPESELDFLIMSFVLPYTGSISGYSIEKDGNSKDKDVTYDVKGLVDRYYYALAFGTHEELAMLDYKIKEGFSGIESSTGKSLNVKSYLYRDIFYSQTETITYDYKNNPVTDADFTKNNPAQYVLNDGKGNAVETASKSEVKDDAVSSEAGGDDLFEDLGNNAEPEILLTGDMFDDGGNQKSGGDDVFGENNAQKQILPNLEVLSEEALKSYIEEKAAGTVYSYKYILPVSGNEWKCGYTLENSDYYEFDTENAVSYVYVPQGDKNDVMVTGEEASGWLSGETLKERGIDVEITSDNVVVGSSGSLNGVKPAVVVSIPVVFNYNVVNTHYERKQVDQELIDWVNRCNIPDQIEKGKEYERLTHTLFFDQFIDKITDGYKNISEAGQKKEVKTDDPVSYTAVVDKLNIIIVAENTDGSVM